ncbi:MAG: adenosylcobinamide-GDP ribazoletransferase [Clostridium sp.]
MNLLGSFVIAFSMYSKIPMPQVEWTKERMRYAMCFFPLIGVVIGGLLLLFAYVAEKTGMGRLCFTLLGVSCPLLVTGGIHMDGFLDVSDARGSYSSREKKLEILKDPHTGAFAIIKFGIYMLLYIGAFSELDLRGIWILSGAFVLTRALSGLAVVTFPMARNDGLAATFSQAAVKKIVAVTMILYILASACFMIRVGGWIGGICLIGAAATYVWYYNMSIREFGGITGDLAGYFLQICELVILLLGGLL